MNNEDLHRWTISKELERPDVADVMRELREIIAARPPLVTLPSLAPWLAPCNVVTKLRDANQPIYYAAPEKRGFLDTLLGR
jgi:hypothetical protein